MIWHDRVLAIESMQRMSNGKRVNTTNIVQPLALGCRCISRYRPSSGHASLRGPINQERARTP
jgi:hypothetical protein